jgi:hypothetical protein
MTKIGDYRRTLAELDEWEPFLLAESGLPGPRGNIELGQAVADVGSRVEFEDLLAWTQEVAPVGSREFAFCGTVGLGKLAAEVSSTCSPAARLASDPMADREAVAMTLSARRRGHAGAPRGDALLGARERPRAAGGDRRPVRPALLRDSATFEGARVRTS